jgi:hypothetical protein
MMRRFTQGLERPALARSNWVAACGALLIVGCSDPNVGVVTGSITVDGTPAKSGSIAFFPVNGKSSIAGAEIIDGHYRAEVAVGSSNVEIRVPKIVGRKKLYDTPDSPIKDIMTESLPGKYNDATELTLDVQPGVNEQDYELTSGSRLVDP